MPLILGSQSPRRREVLSFFSLPFEQHSPPFDEDAVPFNGDPADYVRTLARGKAGSLVGKFPSDIILTADTIVFRERKLYLKPKDDQEAYRFLLELTGQWHSVYTGVAVQRGDEVYTHAEETRVLFNTLSEAEIRHYLKQIHWADKAGGYAIQMGGGLIVRKIEGCYYNAVGLPINTVRMLLQKMGIELWDYVI